MTPAELDEKVAKLHYLKEVIMACTEAIIRDRMTDEERDRLRERRATFEAEMWQLRGEMKQ